jgi:Flp pilus assembly protein TadD
MECAREHATFHTMRRRFFPIKHAVAAAFCVLPLMAAAEDRRVDTLLDRLADPELRNAEVVTQEIYMLWSRSGSPSADYLLERGRAALQSGDMEAAYDHLTALTDHAPGFAEGWNVRATMFFQTGRFGLSIDDIRRVLALEPRHFGALTGLGIMLEEMGEWEPALEALTRAQEINPHQPQVAEAIARIERELAGQTL